MKLFTDRQQINRDNILLLFLLTIIFSICLSILLTSQMFHLGQGSLFGEISYFLGNCLGRMSSMTGIPFFFLYFAKNNIWRSFAWLIWICFVFLYIASVQIEMM